MTRTNKHPYSDHLVRYLAGRGCDAIDDWQALIDAARAMLASGELKEEEITAYPWELERHAPPTERTRIWFSYMSDHATGAGLTTTIFAALAHSEAEFRRSISANFDRNTAHYADVVQGMEGLDTLEEGTSAFLSPMVRARLMGLGEGKERPAAFSLLIQWHANFA